MITHSLYYWADVFYCMLASIFVLVILPLLFIFGLMIIDFIIYNITGKCLWHKIIKKVGFYD